MGRVGVLMLLPTLGEHVLFVGLEHRELANLFKIARETASPGDDGWKCFRCHLNLSLRFDCRSAYCSTRPRRSIGPSRTRLNIELGDMAASIRTILKLASHVTVFPR